MVNKFSNIKERVLYISKYKGVSLELFCESIGMTYGSFKGSAKERPLNSDAIEKILSLHDNINADWLILGNGEMIKSTDIECAKEEHVKLTFTISEDRHFFDRLDAFMKFKGLNDNKITVEADISNGVIGKARKRGSLGLDNISKILYAYPELDANWLLTGEGYMFKNGGLENSSDKDYIIDLQKDKIKALQTELSQIKKEYTSDNNYRMVSEPHEKLKKPESNTNQ